MLSQTVRTALTVAAAFNPHARGALWFLRKLWDYGPWKTMIALLLLVSGGVAFAAALIISLAFLISIPFGQRVGIPGQGPPIGGVPGPPGSSQPLSTTPNSRGNPVNMGEAERLAYQMPDSIPEKFKLPLAIADIEKRVPWYRGAALIESESSWVAGLTSSAGAHGYCQFQRPTYESLGGNWATVDSPDCVAFMADYLNDNGAQSDFLCAIYYYKGGRFRQPQCDENVKRTDPDVLRHIALAEKYRLTARAPLPERPTCRNRFKSPEGFVWPVIDGFQVVTVEFGVPSLVEGSHTGLDLAGLLQSPVCATADGTVIASGSAAVLPNHGCNGYGNFVVISHKNGYYSLYGHLHERRVVAGDQVRAGEVIGTLGSTGCSTGPHVHFIIGRNGTPVSPRQLLPTQIA